MDQRDRQHGEDRERTGTEPGPAIEDDQQRTAELRDDGEDVHQHWIGQVEHRHFCDAFLEIDQLGKAAAPESKCQNDAGQNDEPGLIEQSGNDGRHISLRL